MAAWPITRAQNPWSLAPDSVLFLALPWLGADAGSFEDELASRGIALYQDADARTVALKWNLNRLSERDRRLLARRAATALERNPDHPLESYLLFALGDAGADSARAAPLLARGLASPREWARLAAVESIRILNPDVALVVPPLVERLRGYGPGPHGPDFTDRWVRPDPQLLIAFPVEPQSEPGGMLLVIEMLGRYRAAEAVPPLAALLDADPPPSRNRRVSEAAATALGRIGAPAVSALPVLRITDQDLSSSSYEEIYRIAAELLILGVCENESAALERVLGHESWVARGEVVRRLTARRETAAAHADALLPLLNDPEPRVVLAVASGLLRYSMHVESCYAALLHVLPGETYDTLRDRMFIIASHGLDVSPLVPRALLLAYAGEITDSYVLDAVEAHRKVMEAAAQAREAAEAERARMLPR